MKTNPESTICFRKQIKEKSEKGTYRINVRCAEMILPLDIFPEVFPPQEELLLGEYAKNFPDITSTDVADIGTGSGIEAICATLLGARHVDAIDISPLAINCAKQNSRLNKVEERITFVSSDLFANISHEKKYGLMLANLPFVNFDGGKAPLDIALYDDNLAIHKRFLAEAKKYLTNDGIILLPHANPQSADTQDPNQDFDILEEMIIAEGYALKIIAEKSYRPKLKWKLYELKV